MNEASAEKDGPETDAIVDTPTVGRLALPRGPIAGLRAAQPVFA